MKKWEIWGAGSDDMNMKEGPPFAPPYKYGEQEANTFQEACDLFFAKRPALRAWSLYVPGRPFYYTSLHDNYADAFAHSPQESDS